MRHIKRNITNVISRMKGLGPRVRAFSVVVLMVVSMLLTLPLVEWWAGRAYRLSEAHANIVGTPNPALAKKLAYNQKEKTFEFNADDKPVPEDITPDQMTPKQLKKIMGNEEKQSELYSLDLHQDGNKGVTFYDTNLEMSFSLVPQFKVGTGYKIDDRLIYPVDGAKAVYTVKGNGLKEDILYDKAPKDGKAKFGYRLDLPKELEARLNDDGSIGVYSGDPMLFGNISASMAEDQERLKSVREHAEKSHLVFEIPKPVIVAEEGVRHQSRAWFSLADNKLTLSAEKLDTIAGAFSIDPTVVITSTADFWSGNDEGDVTFGTDQISRGQMTGGTTGAWASTSSYTTGRYGEATVVHNGYIYITGGYDGNTSENTCSGGVSSNYCNDIQYAPINANGTLGTFNYTSSFNGPKDDHTALTYNSYFYIIGNGDYQYAPINANGTLGSFSSTSSLPVSRSGRSFVIYNGYLYGLGGNGGGIHNDVQYAPINANGTLGAWTTNPTSFANGRYRHKSVGYNGYIYVMGGYDNTNFHNDVQYAPINANGTVGTWAATTSFTTARQYHQVSVYSGYLYVVGGSASGGVRQNDVQYAPINANGTVGTWAATTSLTSTRSSHSTAFYNGYIYTTKGTTLATDFQYSKIDNPGSTTNYTATTSLPTTDCGLTLGIVGRSNFSTVVHNGYIYVTGGFNGTCTLNDVRYATINANGTIGSWANAIPPLGSSFTTARYQHTSLAHNGYLYVLGGLTSNSGGTHLNSVQFAPLNANGTHGTWATTTSFTTVRRAHASVIYNGYMYVLGGTNGSPLSDIQYAPINANGTIGTWVTNTTSLPVPLFGFGAAINGNHLYISAGTTSGGTSVTDVRFAPINANASVGSWTSTTSLGANRWSSTAEIYNGNMYVIGGGSNGSPPSVEYAPINANGTLGIWTTGSSYSTSRHEHTSIVHNGYVYVVGGRSIGGGTYLGDVQFARINNGGPGSSGAYAATTSFTTARYGHTSVVYNSYLYVLGGFNGSYLSDVQYAPINANGTLGTWATTTALTTARSLHTSVAYNGYLYVIGGYDGSSNRNDVQYAPINANGTLGTWATTTSFTTVRYSHTSVAYNGYLYVIGGTQGVTHYNDVQYAPINANGTLGTWATTTSFTTVRFGHTSVVIAGYLYVIGGDSGGASYRNDVQYAPINANGTLGTWATTTSFTTVRGGHASVAHNGYLYVIGGYDGSSNRNDVQYAPINANGTIGTWATTTSFTTVRENHTSVAHNGYLYVIGGHNGSTRYNDVQYAQLNSMPRKARYSKLVDLGTSANLTNISYTGNLPEGKPDISFRIAGTDGTFGVLNSAVGLNGSCSAHTGRYVLVTLTMNDAYRAVYPDSSYQGSIQDFTVTYTASGGGVPVDARLQRGKYFLNQLLQPLDTQKLTGSGGC